MYWARSRVLEYLNFVSGRLPQGVNPSLGPDATGVGWVYEYILESDQHDLSQLRTIQDWFLRYELTSVTGVAEVASNSAVPVLFGVLTVNNIEQAIERSGTKMGNKGADVAAAAIEMVNLHRNLDKALKPK